MRRSVLIFLCAAALFFAGCQARRKPVYIAEKPPVEEEEKPAVPDEGVFVFINIIPRSEDTLHRIKKLFEDNPAFKAGISIPCDFFENPQNSGELIAYYKKLCDEKRASIYMRLKHEPVLPLIADNSNYLRPLADSRNSRELFYRWPQDIRDQLALERESFRNIWGFLPAGFMPFGGFLDGPSARALAHANVQLVFCGSPHPDGEPAAKTKRYDIVFASDEANRLIYDASPPQTEDERFKPSNMPKLFVFDEPYLNESNIRLERKLSGVIADLENLGAVYLIPEEYIKAKKTSMSFFDFENVPLGSWRGDTLSYWIGESEEDAAWEMLSKARNAVEEYKNSGKADIRRLDSAMQEIYLAGSNTYFYYFGDDKTGPDDQRLDQMFRAGLMNIYRLIKQTPPEELYQPVAHFRGSFAGLGKQDVSFEKGFDFAVWTDFEGDDYGDSTLEYPVIEGAGETAGLADLLSFGFKVYEETIVYKLKIKRLDNFWNAPLGFSFPLIDVYIDLNNRYGAGSTSALSDRKVSFNEQDGWEYVLVINGWGARLYRSSLTGGVFKVSSLECKKVNDNEIEIIVPRNVVRGNPFNWGYGVLAMGYSRFSMKDPPSPLGVDTNPSENNFTSPYGQDAAPVVDIIVHNGQSQKDILNVGGSRKKIIIPMLRANQ